jgi:hypothetical protein
VSSCTDCCARRSWIVDLFDYVAQTEGMEASLEQVRSAPDAVATRDIIDRQLPRVDVPNQAVESPDRAHVRGRFVMERTTGAPVQARRAEWLDRLPTVGATASSSPLGRFVSVSISTSTFAFTTPMVFSRGAVTYTLQSTGSYSTESSPELARSIDATTVLSVGEPGFASITVRTPDGVGANALATSGALAMPSAPPGPVMVVSGARMARMDGRGLPRSAGSS